MITFTPNIPNIFRYTGATPGRLVDNPQLGEIDLRNTFTPINTKALFYAINNSQPLYISIPENTRSSIKTLSPNQDYVIIPLQSFPFNLGSTSPAQADYTRRILNAISGMTYGFPSDEPPPPPPSIFPFIITSTFLLSPVTANGITFSANIGDQINYSLPAGGILSASGFPVICKLKIGNATVANLDLIDSYLGNPFQFYWSATSSYYQGIFAEGNVSLTPLNI